MQEETELPSEGWEKAGSNITYKLSKLSQVPTNADGYRMKRYYMVSFEYTFKKKQDEVYFAYSIPYTVSKMHNLLKGVVDKHSQEFPNPCD